jgi:exonuclease VII small subunit
MMEESKMAADNTFEDRLSALEATVSRLQREILSLRAGANWLDRVVGSMKDEPAFLEAMEYGREFRQADRPSEDAAE